MVKSETTGQFWKGSSISKITFIARGVARSIISRSACSQQGSVWSPRLHGKRSIRKQLENWTWDRTVAPDRILLGSPLEAPRSPSHYTAISTRILGQSKCNIARESLLVQCTETQLLHGIFYATVARLWKQFCYPGSSRAFFKFLSPWAMNYLRLSIQFITPQLCYLHSSSLCWSFSLWMTSTLQR